MIKIRMKNINAVSAKLELLKLWNERAFGAALNTVGEDIMAKSQEIVPLDQNNLAPSGHVKPIRGMGGVIKSIILSYGLEEEIEYAAKQHEDTTLRHAPGRSAKYLEKPFYDAIGGMASKIASRMKSFMR